MNLAEIEKNKAQFIEELKAARRFASSEVHVNSGICTAEDISAIINNRVTEKTSWEPLYQYAVEFD
jgi:hypothetical protein